MGPTRKAVITAAGRGTRQYPASATVQKELFPMVDRDGFCKPVLQITVEELLASGIDEVCIVANPVNKHAIEAHFTPATQEQLTVQFGGKPWAAEISEKLGFLRSRITVVEQTEQLGFGHAVLQAKDWVNGDTFVLSIGDHIYSAPGNSSCVRQVLDFSEMSSANAVSALTRVNEENLSRYGTIYALPSQASSKHYLLKRMQEKPTVEYARANLVSPGLPVGTYFCFFGIHVFPPLLFDLLEDIVNHDLKVRGEYQLTSALEALLEMGSYEGCEVDGKTFDMGIPEGYLQTQIAIALQSPYRETVLNAVRGTNTH